jgi:hypothetical protein
MARIFSDNPLVETIYTRNDMSVLIRQRTPAVGISMVVHCPAGCLSICVSVGNKKNLSDETAGAENPDHGRRRIMHLAYSLRSQRS